MENLLDNFLILWFIVSHSHLLSFDCDYKQTLRVSLTINHGSFFIFISNHFSFRFCLKLDLVFLQQQEKNNKLNQFYLKFIKLSIISYYRKLLFLLLNSWNNKATSLTSFLIPLQISSKICLLKKRIFFIQIKLVLSPCKCSKING